MVVRQRWGSAVVFSVLLHVCVFVFAGIFLPDTADAPTDATGELAWLDVGEERSLPAEQAAKPVEETALLPSAEEPEPTTLPLPPLEEAVKKPPPKREIAADADGRAKQPQKQRRDYPTMRKPNKPAVLREETKRGLTEKETSYRGRVQFFADISREGRVTDIQGWQFEPEITDAKERLLIEERLAQRIKENWRYAPSLTPEGAPTTQTKSEELAIPEILTPRR